MTWANAQAVLSIQLSKLNGMATTYRALRLIAQHDIARWKGDDWRHLAQRPLSCLITPAGGVMYRHATASADARDTWRLPYCGASACL